MREMAIPEEEVKALNTRYLAGDSLAEIVGDYGISSATAINYFKRLGLIYPRPKAAAPLKLPQSADLVTLVTESGPPYLADLVAAAAEPITEDAPAMDDPETYAAATESITKDAPAMDDPGMIDVLNMREAIARSRARDLHERVIAVQELTPPVLARKQYSVPSIIESGSLMDVMNPHAAAKMVEALVAKLNQVPGVQAYFEWRSEGKAGQPLVR